MLFVLYLLALANNSAKGQLNSLLAIHGHVTDILPAYNILPEHLDKQLQHFGTNHIVDYEHLIDAPKAKPY
jgi:hypothetical protein